MARPDTEGKGNVPHEGDNMDWEGRMEACLASVDPERFAPEADAAANFLKALAHDGPTLVDVISQPLHEAAAPVSGWVA